MTRKIALSVAFLFTMVSIVFLVVYAFTIIKEAENREEELKNRFLVDQVAPEAPDTTLDCTRSDTIEYYYYREGDPFFEINNKFGLYVYAENASFFELAQKLVNSNGGEYGYVLIPYNIRDRDTEKWGRVFGQLQNKKLIPIIQLWSTDNNNYKENTKYAAKFLDEFVWPIRYRYISVYNEPNDPKFWFGEADPENYAEVLDYTVDVFKDENKDFIVMNGALNASLPSDGSHTDPLAFISKMNEAVPGIFNKLDAWASHSYPQPNFSGKVEDTGLWSIRAYESELTYLKDSIGVTKELPVFITETGWAHAEGENYNGSYLPVEEVAENFKRAFREVWLKDPRVRAVIPFTIRYDPPWDHFSFINKDYVPYLHYTELQEIKKIVGTPPALERGTTIIPVCEEKL